MACGICRKPGHNRRSCAAVAAVAAAETWPLLTEHSLNKPKPVEVSPASVASQLTDLTGQRFTCEGALMKLLSREIVLTLEDEVMRRLDAQVAVVAQGAAAREFGIEVTREVTARVALLRGLDVMEAGAGVSNGRPDQANQPAQQLHEEKAEEDAVVDRNTDGTIRTPPGWELWKSAVPEEQMSVDDYYSSKGWGRWCGQVGNETIVFYWTNKESLQGVTPYTESDETGKTIIVQPTPWGEGHIVPAGWAS